MNKLDHSLALTGWKRQIVMFSAALCLLATGVSHAAAQAVYADVVLDFFDSGAGPIPGPYGHAANAPGLGPVSPSVVLGPPPSSPVTSANPLADWLSLPTNSYVTVGFVNNNIINGPGNDIFIQTLDASDSAGESANVFVSSDDASFTLLGKVTEGGTFGLDLATIGFTQPVKAVRIVGLDMRGSYPGFDLVAVRALNSQPASVPEPGSVALLISIGLSGAGFLAHRRKQARCAA